MTPAARFAIIALLAAPITPALAACGDRGGPGYRSPSGKCVSWAEIGRVCGAPPTSKCKAENTVASSQEAADHGAKIQGLKSSAQAKP
jgi:hypothetical protein